MTASFSPIDKRLSTHPSLRRSIRRILAAQLVDDHDFDPTLSLNVQLRPASLLSSDEPVRLNQLEWQLVSCISQGMDLHQIVAATRYSPREVSRGAARLLDRGLVELIPSVSLTAERGIYIDEAVEQAPQQVPPSILDDQVQLTPVKVVVTGMYGTGKSQFIHTACAETVFDTDMPVSDPDCGAEKASTTVGFDFGIALMADCPPLHLYGTPGQPRFMIAAEALVYDCAAYIVLVDSTQREVLDETIGLIQRLTRLAPAPVLVVANKQDLPGAVSCAEISRHLDALHAEVVVPCVATDARSVRVILQLLCRRIGCPIAPEARV